MPTLAWQPFAILRALWFAAGLAVVPFADCLRCFGRGRWPNPNPPQFFARGRHIYCSVCRGTGRRLRKASR